jgi:hypothetical protein
MKAFLVILVLVTGATAMACGPAEVAEAISASEANEPTALVLSGSALLALAGALRRLSS